VKQPDTDGRDPAQQLHAAGVTLKDLAATRLTLARLTGGKVDLARSQARSLQLSELICRDIEQQGQPQ